jgi:hypothetical protein
MENIFDARNIFFYGFMLSTFVMAARLFFSRKEKVCQNVFSKKTKFNGLLATKNYLNSSQITFLEKKLVDGRSYCCTFDLQKKTPASDFFCQFWQTESP